jgi:hypothetical protein
MVCKWRVGNGVGGGGERSPCIQPNQLFSDVCLLKNTLLPLHPLPRPTADWQRFVYKSNHISKQFKPFSASPPHLPPHVFVSGQRQTSHLLRYIFAGRWGAGRDSEQRRRCTVAGQSARKTAERGIALWCAEQKLGRAIPELGHLVYQSEGGSLITIRISVSG